MWTVNDLIVQAIAIEIQIGGRGGGWFVLLLIPGVSVQVSLRVRVRE